MPLPAARLLTSTSTCTLVPDFQYCFGRQCASVSLIQLHEPTVAGLAVTVMCRSNSALFFTGMSNCTITGMPTPTVSFFSGVTLA